MTPTDIIPSHPTVHVVTRHTDTHATVELVATDLPTAKAYVEAEIARLNSELDEYPPIEPAWTETTAPYPTWATLGPFLERWQISERPLTSTTPTRPGGKG